MRYSQLPLVDLINYFLSVGKEGDFWDFKQEWHENIEDLLKDIICFANTIHDENCYIVFGVSDDCRISVMVNTRRKQADIIDAISNLNFAGDNLPVVSVETITIEGKELDVLIIYNTNNTPIYLKKPYGKMRQGCVYSRVGDRNTPDNGNAEIETIELLWKKRFGLLKPPLEFIIDSLDRKNDWIASEYGFYFTFKPEYTIEYEIDEDLNIYSDGDEFYSYTQVNESTSYAILQFNVNHTTVKKVQVVSLDSGRLIIPVPDWGFIDLDDYHEKYISYKYYINDSLVERLLRFMYDPMNQEQRYAYDNYKKVILFFESEEQKERFERYVIEHQDEYQQKMSHSNKYEHISTGEKQKTETYIQQLRTGLVLNEMLNKFKEE